MKPQNPTAAQSGLINDVVAPVKAAPAEAPLAEPPKEATFVEEPTESLAAHEAPITSVASLAKELPALEAKSTAAVVKTLPAKSAHEGQSNKPIFAIALSVVMFVALAVVAFYAYTKTA